MNIVICSWLESLWFGYENNNNWYTREIERRRFMQMADLHHFEWESIDIHMQIVVMKVNFNWMQKQANLLFSKKTFKSLHKMHKKLILWIHKELKFSFTGERKLKWAFITCYNNNNNLQTINMNMMYLRHLLIELKLRENEWRWWKPWNERIFCGFLLLWLRLRHTKSLHNNFSIDLKLGRMLFMPNLIE